MNLISSQKALLSKIVEVYDSGCEYPFLFVETHLGSMLVYTGRPKIALSPAIGITDFQRLASEGMIDIRPMDSGSISGKVTSKGIYVARQIQAQEEIMQHGEIRQSPQAEQTASVSANMQPRRSPFPPPPMPPLPSVKSIEATPTKSRFIFIGHGHAKDWLELRDFLERDLKLTCIEFNSEVVAGMATKERLEQMLNTASFAFLVMTAEDEHSEAKHARANVIHEAGLFQGKLGFEKAILLLEDGCSEFSNIHGLTNIPFRRGDIQGAFHKVRKVLVKHAFIPN
jgi:hypothetical protein